MQKHRALPVRRRALRRKDLQSLLKEFPHLRAHHRFVKAFLALEVVIEQGFIHPGGSRDGVGSRPRQAVFRVHLLGSLQDGSPRLNAVPVPSVRWNPSWRSPFRHLTNQIVKYHAFPIRVKRRSGRTKSLTVSGG